jgi:DNA-binding response OmpR family regulator
VHRAAELLGHPLELASTPGRGTCVQLTLPLAEAPLPARGEPALTEADRQCLQGAFVVLLEDDPALREALAALLRHNGCQVLEAAGADEALQALAGHLRCPDLLLCDMRLGGGADGLQAVDALRSAVAEPVPALILTGETDEATLARLAAGGPPVLYKPVPPGELLVAVAAGLRRVGVQAAPQRS